MKITSPVLKANQPMPVKHTCAGENISPPLAFSDVPDHAKSLCLIFEDTDSDPKTWVHWLVFNIPPSATVIEEGEIPKGGIEGLANNKSFGYEGPCPKYFRGKHTYKFSLLALDTVLSIPKGSDKNRVLKNAKDHIIDQASLSLVQAGELT